jgi:hypothetical protein
LVFAVAEQSVQLAPQASSRMQAVQLAPMQVLAPVQEAVAPQVHADAIPPPPQLSLFGYFDPVATTSHLLPHVAQLFLSMVRLRQAKPP